MHTFNPQLILDKVTCLESLQVNLLNTPNFPRHGEEMYKSFDGVPSQDIAKILRQNPRLKDLSLCLDATNHAGQDHDLLSTEREHALENIGESLPPLRSLTLKGKFQFTPSARATWNNFDWGRLRNLSVLTESLAQDISTYYRGQCSSLRSLRLEAPDITTQVMPAIMPNRFETDISPLISSLALKELSLHGYHPSNLDGLERNGSKLRRLAFHIRENANSWIMPGPRIRTSAKFVDLLLTPEGLGDIERNCPSLEWLAIDISPFHLEQHTSSGGLPDPLFGFAASTIEAAKKNILAASPHQGFQVAQILIVQFNMQDQDLHPVFPALAKFRSLRHLRLYMHRVAILQWPGRLVDAINTFLWLRKHKQGVPLESLVIMPQGQTGVPPLAVHSLRDGSRTSVC